MSTQDEESVNCFINLKKQWIKDYIKIIKNIKNLLYIYNKLNSSL